MIVLALAIRRLPYALRACYAALQQISVSLEEAAENLGATKTRTVRRIVVPLMTGGILAGLRHQLRDGGGRALGHADAGAVELRRAAGLRTLRLHAVAGRTRAGRCARRDRGGPRGALHLRVASDHRTKPEGPIARANPFRFIGTDLMNQPVRATQLGTPAVDVDIRNVNLFYGTNHVLKNINLHVRPGEFFAFLGPSGCGKTTLLRLIAGFNQRAERRGPGRRPRSSRACRRGSAMSAWCSSPMRSGRT